MDSNRTSRQEENIQIVMEGDIGEIEPIPVSGVGGGVEKQFETLEVIISAFNQRFADINWGEGVDAEEAEKTLIHTIPDKIQDNLEGLMAILNSDKTNAKEESNSMVRQVMQSLMFTNTGIFKKIIR